jgi:hypothetical protein
MTAIECMQTLQLYEVFTAVVIKPVVFWNVTPCISVDHHN